ncbi:hypothetical protein MMC18_005449 [Xylographa bjoerkii]|nr:hypothetical protein [Xylographa bjoerkii]
MSNYHGIPHYGGPFNYNGHFPQPIPPPQQVGPYGMMPQTSFPPPRGPPSIPPQQNYQPPHFSNPYNYSTSSAFSHNSTPGSGPPPVIPYSYYANYASHAANGIPPPPFPPMPIPHHNFTPQRSAASIPLPASPGTFASPAGLPPKPPSPTGPTNGPFENGTALVAPGNDREDGELSDVEKRRTPSDSDSMKLDEQQQGRKHNINQSITSLSPPRDYENPASQSYSQVIHTINAQSALPNNSVNIGSSAATANQKFFEPHKDSSTVYLDSKNVSEHRAVGPHSGLPDPDRPKSSTNFGKQDSGSEYQILRGQVKAALLDLYEGQIGFESLLAEGIDASTLRGLYHDIGIQVTESPTISDNLPPTGQNSLQSTISENVLPNDINGLSEPPLNSLASSKFSPEVTRPHKFPVPSSSILVSQPTQSQSIPGSRTILVPASSEALKDTRNNSPSVPASQQAKPTVVGPIKTPATFTSGDRTLKRKDYIAKMLAAKAGKGAALKSPKPVEPAKVLKALPTQDIAAADIVVVASPPDSSFSLANRVPPSTQDDLEAKKKASTDLARRKMEALMTRNTEAHVAPTDSVGVPQTEENMPQMASPVLRENSMFPTSQSVLQQNEIVEQSVVIPDSSSQQYTPATPFFAPLKRKPTIGLPGLSMSYSSVSSPIVQRGPTSHQVAVGLHQALPLSISEQDNRTTLTSPPRPEVPIAKPSIDSSKSVDDGMTGIVATTIVETASPIITRKRATAADFIDGPADNMKRRAGSNGHIEVVIEVSDDEGLAEDDDMDIESVVQDSLTEVLHPAQASASKPKAIRDLPPLTNFPSRPSAPIAHTNSPTPVQNPGKSGEPKELTETEEKIRLLKQMIAEKEERQRAKLTSSSAQSPGPTTLRLPSAPTIRDPSPARSSSGSLILEKKTRALDVVKNELEDQKSVLVAAETAVKGRLEAEETAHASVSARAEEERVEASRATTAAERQYREKRRLALEAALPELDAQIQVARSKLDDISKQRIELEAELQRGSEGRKRIMEELDILLAALEVDKNMEDALSDDALVRGSGSGLTQAQDGQSIFQGSSARLTRESTTPSTIASTISHAIQDDNKNVIAEIHALSSRQGSAEEIMDISSVSNDEAQLVDYNPNDTVEHNDDIESDFGYDEYEPRLENDLLSQPSAERDNSTHFVDDEGLDAFPLSQAQTIPTNQGNIARKLTRSEADSSSLEDGEVSRSMSPSGADDSDDYEPPEPQPILDNRASQETEIFSPRSPTPQLEDRSEADAIPALLIPVRGSPIVADLTADGGTSRDVSTVRNVGTTV